MAKEDYIGALWLDEDGSYSGKITIEGKEYPLKCWKNDYAKKENRQPHFRFAHKKKKTEHEQKKAEIIQNTKPIPDDDLPF